MSETVKFAPCSLKAAKAVWAKKNGWDTVEQLAEQIDRETGVSSLLESLKQAVRFVYHIPHCDSGRIERFREACPKCQFEAAIATAEGQ